MVLPHARQSAAVVPFRATAEPVTPHPSYQLHVFPPHANNKPFSVPLTIVDSNETLVCGSRESRSPLTFSMRGYETACPRTSANCSGNRESGTEDRIGCIFKGP